MGFYHLSSYAVRAGYRVESFDCVDSTNILAGEFAVQGDAGRLWIIANEQKSGRARRGRAWLSAPGNLYASLLLVEDFDLARVATLGFVAGISLMEAVQQAVPAAVLANFPVKLKWPNDVLARGAKMAGILLEQIPLGKGRSGIVIGIGVNVATSPPDLSYPVTSLRQIGAQCSVAYLFTALSHCWVDNYNLWDHGAGLEIVRNKWLLHAANLGQDVHITVNGCVISGIFETIDSNCYFILRKKDGQEIAIPAGDVHFGTVASVYTQS